MARSITLGNGNILVGLDYRGQVRDFYFPYVGHNNHVSGASGSFVHRIGVYADGEMSWLEGSEWSVIVGDDTTSLVGSLTAKHERLGLLLTSIDAVHNEANVFLRQFTLTNLRPETRSVTLYLAQQFRISESRRGDTGLYDPRVKAITHYKGNTTFLVNAFVDDQQFTEYNIGLFGIEGREGTYMDAQDNFLEKNPVEHGSVDSIIGLPMVLNTDDAVTADYWIVVAGTMAQAHDLNAYVLLETPARLIASTKNYWQAWVDKEDFDTTPLGEDLALLYKRSLTIIRTHTDNRGAIIASSDTDMLHHGRDTYSYVWPRDGAIVAHALDVAGYSDITKKFFSFMADRLERGGYLMHKYAADGALGSSWHPWVIEGQPEFPIQEDETALVLYMLHQHYLLERDLEYIESLYNPFIEPAANFMVEYIEARLGLPQNSYDLWEEKYCISTYTSSAVYGALSAAAKFAEMLGKVDAARTYNAVAQKMQSAILEHLYDEERGYFIKGIRAYDDKEDVRDTVVDMSSFFGPFYFGVIEAADARVARMFKVVEDTLKVQAASEGYVRYERDNYYKMQDADSPNPWVVTTMWVAQYLIAIATSKDDLTRAYAMLAWTASHATGSGTLAEQMHPHTRVHLSTAPLVWSHAEYVMTCRAYLQKLAALT